ncbi:MAG: hypothetical protein J6J41_09275 [Clostridia bacterium]|nr:hypothetical protein [Clostridia bacterium]
MKRILAILLLLCLTLGSLSVAQAAVSITKQPETQTVKAGGNVTYKIKAKGVGSGTPITWHFTNPATGESVTGKKLSSVVKGVKVKNPNSLSITLRKVPEEMHGWTAYCHIGPKSGGVDSDTVTILIAGLPEPEFAPAPAPAGEEESAPVPEEAEDDGEDEGEGKSASKSSGKSSSKASSVTPEPEIIYVTPTPEPLTPIVIKGSKVELFKLDRSGNPVGDAATELTFDAGTTANFYVRKPDSAEGIIQYLLIDDLRITPTGDAEALEGMTVRGLKKSASVKLKLADPSELAAAAAAAEAAKAEEAPVDESTLVTVTCTNCRFNGWRNKLAQSGQVPAGTTITVIADGGLIGSGYFINGAKKGEYKNQATFKLVVEADTTIEMKPQ